MILNRLTLSDFRAYRGVHEINLTPGDNRPIILFGGLNGAGKTTLLLALKLVLYGRLALGPNISTAKYEMFIRSCIHIMPKAMIQKNSTSIELDFCYGKMGRQLRYVIRRSWYDDGRSVHEKLVLRKDGQLQDAISEKACQGFLNALVPIGVSELFFFDGEKISKLAEDDTGDVLKQAIFRLLGLNIVKRLREDLRVYLLRKEGEGSNSKSSGELDSLRAEYEELLKLLVRERKALRAAQNQEAALKADRNRVEMRLAEHGGEWGISREVQQRRRKELEERLKKEEKELREVFAGVYPLSLASQALTEALNLARDGLASQNDILSNQILEGFANKLKNKLDEVTADVVDQVLTENLKLVDSTKNIFNLDYQTISEMDYLIQRSAPESIGHVGKLVGNIEGTKETLDQITLQMEQAPDEARLTSDFAELASLNEAIGHITAEITVQEREIRKRYSDAISLARALRDRHQQLSEQQDLKQPLEYANRARHLLLEFGQSSTEKRLQQLESEFSKAFHRLSRKEDMIAKASIDPKRFTVKLLDQNDVEIQKSRLSAGERQIYAIAMLEALAHMSGRKLPVVIDTPLGRLDSHHRANLVQDYFPRISHQVILLSTDTEVNEFYHRELTPSISHCYEILYDDKTHAAQLREGYFWQPENKSTAA